MARVSREKLIELYRDLPPDVAEVYENASTSEVMLDVGRKNSIPIDQLGRLSYEVGLVMVGASPAREFIENIERGLGVPRAKAVEIARDINTRLFSPIRESLKRIHKLGTSEQLIDERESSAIESVQIPIKKPANAPTAPPIAQKVPELAKPAGALGAAPVALKISEVIKQVALDKSNLPAPEATKVATPPVMQRVYELRNQTSQLQTPISPSKLYIPVTKSETPPLTTPVGDKEKFWGELKGEATSDMGQVTSDMGRGIRKEWLEARSRKRDLEKDDGRIEKMVDEEIALNQKGSLAQIQAREESRVAANVRGLASQKSLEQEVGAIIAKSPLPIPLSTPPTTRPVLSVPQTPAPVRPLEPSVSPKFFSPRAPATASPEPSVHQKPFSPPVFAETPAPIRPPQPITPTKPPVPSLPIPNYKQAGDPYRESVK